MLLKGAGKIRVAISDRCKCQQVIFINVVIELSGDSIMYIIAK